MKIKDRVIYLNNSDIKWFYDRDINFLTKCSKFTNTQGNISTLLELKNKNEVYVNTPSGKYVYKLEEIKKRLINNVYTNYNFVFKRSFINQILTNIFNNSKNNKNFNCYDSFKTYYTYSKISNFCKTLEEVIDVEDEFDKFFNTNNSNVKKWSENTYVLFLKQVISGNGVIKKGVIDKIIPNSESYVCVRLEKYKSLSKSREKKGEVKWFATKQEAKDYRNKLKMLETNFIDTCMSETTLMFNSKKSNVSSTIKKLDRRLLLLL